ncbi:metallophosphoesterase family protein [Pontibacter akesuensis]|uniref:Phosphoesterase, MJ0936 family n=1 Tax=Pontibacter akesuensis TaxID=388950 RepID=A0A1I7FSZ8_9BACT|nr:metallophosphoesterase family protein [Pontibacter akesuensis]GHA60671.1 phosphoesterase [Pontibacter akesuensis]SFU39277.1 phosphoesterase, MJ0936 family [Pontibacter akesuensis]
MKIAFFSDVHANLPALEAVLQDIGEQQVEAVYCLGDLVGYNVWANEVVNLIRQQRIPTIAGNYDEGVGLNSDDCGCAYKTAQDKERGGQSITYTNQIISDDNRRYLRHLPRHIRLEYALQPGERLSILLVHGSPRKINEYLFEDRPDKSLLRLLTDAGADIMLFGHTHKPFHRQLAYEENGSTKYKHAINLGSVGKPKDGDTRACYVLLELHENSRAADATSIDVKFRRASYNVEAAACAVEESLLPNEFADMLRKAY